MNQIENFVRSSGERISARLEKEKQKAWVKKINNIKRRNSAPSRIRKKGKKNKNVENGCNGSATIELKHASVPLMSEHRDLKADDPIDPSSEVEEDDGDPCIICVGSTGAGKSSTISKCTLQNAKSSCGTDRETKKCAKYRKIDDINAPIWVDTVGWDDAECEDEDNFKEVLRFIDKNDITRVQAIIWNVIPNVRRDALLSKQAALIDMFKPKDIWDNVIIVLKQSMNPDNDGKGALRAALEYNPYSKIQVVGYRFLEDPTISDEQREIFEREDTRKVFNVKTNLEIHDLLHEKILEIDKPIKVVFHNSKCIDCNEVGDERLMSAYCHMEEHRVHPGVIEQYHPLKTEFFHPTENHIAEHDGFLQKPWYSFGCFFKTKRYSCCNKVSGKTGCTYKWGCCKQLVNHPSGNRRSRKGENSTNRRGCQERYKCCKAEISSSNGCVPKYACCGLRVVGGTSTASEEGCKRVCKKCNQPWGSAAGTCFKKSHNIRDINFKEPQVVVDNDDTDLIQILENEDDEISTGEKVEIKLNGKNSLPPVILYHVF